MKHIIIPLCGSPIREMDFLAGLCAEEKQHYGIVFPCAEEQTIGVQRGEPGKCWIYRAPVSGPKSEDCLRQCFDELHSKIDPQGTEQFVLDVIVDAAHAKAAMEMIPGIKRAGTWCTLHIIFLADTYSDFAEDQARLYAQIRSDAGGEQNRSDLNWNWVTLLEDVNGSNITGERPRKQREQLLPFILQYDHTGDPAKSCYTYTISSRDVRFDRIREVPGRQATRYACKLIQAGEAYNEMAILLMNGEACPGDINEQRKTLQRNMLQKVQIKQITGPDLLIHKHDPKADAQTRDLLRPLLQDNPELDARLYDSAESEDQLKQLPFVPEAVAAWEDYVLSSARRHTGLNHLRDQLKADSDWAHKLGQDFPAGYYHEDPLQACTSSFKGKDGYGPNAGSAASGDLVRINGQLHNAVFQACLRLIRLRMHLLYARVNEIVEARNRAVKETLDGLTAGEDIERMTPNWCGTIQGHLDEIAATIPMQLEGSGEPQDLIDGYARMLLERLEHQIDYDEGANELASPERINKLMQEMVNQEVASPLVSPPLTGAACREKERRWYLYKDLRVDAGDRTLLQTELPAVLRVISYYLYPAAETAPDPAKEDLTDLLFRKKMNGIQWQDSGTFENDHQEPASAMDTDHQPPERDIPTEDSLRFFWVQTRSTEVEIQYRLAGTSELLLKETRSKASFGGTFEITPPASLPSGARIEVTILFIVPGGHPIGRYSRILRFETAKQSLYAEPETYTEGGWLRKKTYNRLRVRDAVDLNGKLGIRNAVTGCVCNRISWMQDGPDSVSEPLPEEGAWALSNRSDSPYVFQLD